MRVDEVRANGVRLVFEVHGEGPHTVVLCGPIGASAAVSLPLQVPVLVRAGYRVVAFSPRGVPPSEVPEPPYSVADMVADASGLIEHVASERVALIGYSMGALVAQELLLDRPDLCCCGVLLGTLGRKDAFRKALFDASLESLEREQRLPPRMEAVSKAMQLFGPARLDDDDWSRQYLDFALAGTPHDDDETRKGLRGQQAATTAYDDRLKALTKIAVPVLVVGFELDLLVPAKLSREVAAAIPNARYVEILGCGHGGPWEQPEPINAALTRFLTDAITTPARDHAT